MAKDDFGATYRRFAALYANSHAIRGISELEAAVRAAGLSAKDVSDAWLRSLDRDWVYRESPLPFPDEEANRRYRRLLTEA